MARADGDGPWRFLGVLPLYDPPREDSKPTILGERVFDLDRDTIQTLMYLKLSVAGHMTVFVTRTRGPFWSIRPARVLLGAVVGTQVLATLIAVYGVLDLMTPIGWKWALLVWGYALAWFLVNDCVKLLAYRIFDPGQPPLLRPGGALPARRSEGRGDPAAHTVTP